LKTTVIKEIEQAEKHQLQLIERNNIHSDFRME